MYDENTKTLRRNIQDNKMDVSMIGAVYPFELFGANEKKILNTVEKINLTLRTYTGGYLRFEQDSYIGGKNPWPVSTLWMAMYYLKAGNKIFSLIHLMQKLVIKKWHKNVLTS